jgi:hypothetical protein
VEPKEMQILGIPFRTIPRKRTQLRIPFRTTKNRNKLSECCSKPFRGKETNSEQNAAAEYFKNYWVLAARAPCAARTRRFGLINTPARPPPIAASLLLIHPQKYKINCFQKQNASL